MKGRIWIGTKNGLNLFDEIHRSFIRFTTHNGLTNNVIYAILEDEQNNLWLSSNGGLMKFNSESWKCEGFDIIDGIQSTQFNNYSGYKTSQGMMLFGGINGITMFYPSNIKSSKSTNKVLITKLQVNNNVIYANDKSKILSDHISNTKKITLEHKQNSFSVDFVAINLKENEKVDYHYKFEGFEDNWLPANKRRRLSYSHLDPGNYNYKLKIKTN